MKIEEGKRYVRRDGNITGEMKGRRVDSCTLSEYKFIDSMNNEVYTSDGNYFAYERQSGADLIKEYKPKKKMKDTVKVKKQFLLDGHKAACQSWKERIEKEAPELFEKPELEVGKWYKYTTTSGCQIFCLTEITKNGSALGYGIGRDGDWVDYSSDNSIYCMANDYWVPKLVPASEQEVTEVLIKEAKKRGFVKGVVATGLDGEISEITGDFFNNGDVSYLCATEEDCRFSGVRIYEDGKWAEIVEEKKPELVNGEWYTDGCGAGMVNFNGERDGDGYIKGYGFDGCGEWHNNDLGWEVDGNYRKCTKEEITSALIAEAKRRGFEEGVKYISVAGGCSFTHKEGTPLLNRDSGFFLNESQGTVFYMGKWASILPAKEEKVVELTLQEIADKFGVNVESLRVKE
jgi:hypothetical protein